MDSKDILLLKTLYEEKNITHTARRLFISQPAITDRLKRMEAEFGTTLFIRQPRGIQFTSAGELVHQYCLRTEKDYRQVRAALEGLTTHPGGTLSIGCSNVFAKYHMPRLLSQFQKTCPQIQIHLQSGFTHNLYRDFLQGKFQVCIVRGDHNWTEERKFLWQDALCLFSRNPVDLERLPEYPYIHYVTDPLLQDVLDDWWYSHYRETPRAIIVTDAMDTAMKMVQQGLGFTLLSQSCGQDAPDIRPVPLTQSDGSPLMRKTWLYYRKDYQLVSSIKAFVEFMDEQY